MRKIIYLTVSLLFIITISSCKKKAVDVNPAYVGSWSGYQDGNTIKIVISSDSKAEYHKSGNSTVDVTGKARVKGNKFKIFTKKFTINQEPMQIIDTLSTNGYYYTMILDNITFYKY